MKVANSKSFLISAISPDEKFVAIALPSSSSSRILIQVYQGSSLELSLTYNTLSSSDSLQKIVFINSKTLIGLIGTKEVIAWDLTRGVVANKVKPKQDDREFLDIASSTTTSSPNENSKNNNDANNFFILTNDANKIQIHEYNDQYKLIRKIKSGKKEFDGGTTLAVSSKYMIVRTCSGIRIMNRATGQKVGKIKVSNKNQEYYVPMAIHQVNDDNGLSVIATVKDTGAVVLYNLDATNNNNDDNNNNNNCIVEIPRQDTEPPSVLQVVQGAGAANDVDDAGTSLTVLIDYELYNVTTNSNGIYNKLTQVSSDQQQQQHQKSMALFVTNSLKLLALTYQQKLGTGCVIHWQDLKDDKIPPKMDLFAASAPSTTPQTILDNGKSKRKLTPSQQQQDEATVLGPAQGGAEVMAVKRAKLSTNNNVDQKMDVDGDDGNAIENDKGANDDDDDNNNMAIADRLKKLTQTMENDFDDEDDVDEDDNVNGTATAATKHSFEPKKATTESLKELLSQALQSNDDSMLELALRVTDRQIITRSVNEINSKFHVTLLAKLTTRLAAQPLRAETLSPWLSVCLKLGQYKIEHLSALRNLVHERTESFPQLLRLEGRLSLMHKEA